MEFRKLRADEIDVRVSTVSEKGVSLLLFKDARVDQNILDESVGAENWQRHHEVINGNLFCNVGIWVDRRSDGYGEWVWKQDVGVESYTEKEKGQASDSFKRACFNWGIGRELYTAPSIRISDVKIEEKNGKKTTYDKFKVKSIEYTDGKITSLEIVNAKTGKTVYSTKDNTSKPKEDKKKQDKTPEQAKEDLENMKISSVKIEALKNKCISNGVPEDLLLSMVGVDQFTDITERQYAKILSRWQMAVDKARKI